MDKEHLIGALLGWKRTRSLHGIVLTMQIAEVGAPIPDGNLDKVSVSMNDRQLRSLARDLERAAFERGIQLRAPAKRFAFFRRREPQ